MLLSAAVSMHSLAFGQEVEPNDTCLTANYLGSVELAFTLNAALDPISTEGDVDFFVFMGTPNTGLRVDLEGQPTGKGTLPDPYLGVFDGACGQIALDDDGGDSANSRLHFTVPDNGFFVLGVTRCCDSSFTFGGAGSYELTVQEILPPLNDDFSNATLIGALPFSDPVDAAAATVEPGEPTPSCASSFDPGRTLWYRFSPAAGGPISAHISNASVSTVIAAYTGSSIGTLREIGCRAFGGRLTIQASPATAYYFQVASLFGQGGPLQFDLDVTPSPVAGFGFFPFDPSLFENVHFFDTSFDPGEVGVESRTWHFGDGATLTTTDCCPMHRYGADGEYTVQLTVTTFDGRVGSASRPVIVQSHDVSIVSISAPHSAKRRQTRTIVIDLKNTRYPETVEVELFKSVPGGFERIALSQQSVPARPNRRTTFKFNYTFTTADADMQKVTFKAVAAIVGARDALSADNEAISSPPTKVTR